ncbi:hypothetical protein BDV25DRAFT_109569 [Aspergillus avenaceus]|uniref:Uncharacterized protein n=1 Tax=Aspergillus avenaceus TaxID=36643 RepID=A0A5N6U7A7_ASPAV|nr:hypothetical protein BDV25DRAFT_109569 [Aspergillus avenaceus]
MCNYTYHHYADCGHISSIGFESCIAALNSLREGTLESCDQNTVDHDLRGANLPRHCLACEKGSLGLSDSSATLTVHGQAHIPLEGLQSKQPITVKVSMIWNTASHRRGVGSAPAYSPPVKPFSSWQNMPRPLSRKANFSSFRPETMWYRRLNRGSADISGSRILGSLGNVNCYRGAETFYDSSESDDSNNGSKRKVESGTSVTVADDQGKTFYIDESPGPSSEHERSAGGDTDGNMQTGGDTSQTVPDKAGLNQSPSRCDTDPKVAIVDGTESYDYCDTTASDNPSTFLFDSSPAASGSGTPKIDWDSRRTSLQSPCPGWDGRVKQLALDDRSETVTKEVGPNSPGRFYSSAPSSIHKPADSNDNLAEDKFSIRSGVSIGSRSSELVRRIRHHFAERPQDAYDNKVRSRTAGTAPRKLVKREKTI